MLRWEGLVNKYFVPLSSGCSVVSTLVRGSVYPGWGEKTGEKVDRGMGNRAMGGNWSLEGKGVGKKHSNRVLCITIGWGGMLTRKNKRKIQNRKGDEGTKKGVHEN